MLKTNESNKPLTTCSYLKILFKNPDILDTRLIDTNKIQRVNFDELINNDDSIGKKYFVFFKENGIFSSSKKIFCGICNSINKIKKSLIFSVIDGENSSITEEIENSSKLQIFLLKTDYIFQSHDDNDNNSNSNDFFKFKNTYNDFMKNLNSYILKVGNSVKINEINDEKLKLESTIFSNLYNTAIISLDIDEPTKLKTELNIKFAVIYNYLYKINPDENIRNLLSGFLDFSTGKNSPLNKVYIEKLVKTINGWDELSKNRNTNIIPINQNNNYMMQQQQKLQQYQQQQPQQYQPQQYQPQQYQPQQIQQLQQQKLQQYQQQPQQQKLQQQPYNAIKQENNENNNYDNDNGIINRNIPIAVAVQPQLGGKRRKKKRYTKRKNNKLKRTRFKKG